MSGASALTRSMACTAVADRDHLDVLVGERQLDDPLDGDAVVGEQQFVGHVDLLHAPTDVVVDEVDDLLHRRPGQEDALDADIAQARQIDVRMIPPTTTSTSSSPFS